MLHFHLKLYYKPSHIMLLFIVFSFSKGIDLTMLKIDHLRGHRGHLCPCSLCINQNLFLDSLLVHKNFGSFPDSFSAVMLDFIRASVGDRVSPPTAERSFLHITLFRTFTQEYAGGQHVSISHLKEQQLSWLGLPLL